MFHLNKAMIIGNVGRDPDVRTTQDGKDIINFSVATSESWKDKQSGERKVKTEWHRVVVFAQPLTNIVRDRVRKGSKVYVEGAIQTRRWVDQSNNERFTTEVVVYPYTGIVRLLDPPPNHGGNEYHNHNSSVPKEPSSMSIDHGSAVAVVDDEIPF